jgi:1-acyl-sn-glycerol-3-phosphate acyltransferase
MTILKNILGRIFALWGAVIFIITMFPMGLIVLVLYLVKEPQRMIAFQKISRVWISIYFFLIGCRLKIFGKENFRKYEAYVIICNHTSFMDILVTTPFFPGPSKTIAKSELAKIPLFGLIYKSGSVLVNRKDKNSRVNSFKEMKAVLALGISMCIYPEGTRNKTDQPLKEFHNGAFKLAVETQRPILPAVIFNSKKAIPADKTFFFWPAKMQVHYLPPVHVSSTDNYEDVKNNLFGLMSEYFVAHNKKQIYFL